MVIQIRYFMKRILILLSMLILTAFNTGGYPQNKAGQYLKAALEATKSKNYIQAVVLCDAAINLDNTFEKAYFCRGYNKLLLKDYAGALVDFTVCLDLNSENLDAYLYRGLTNQRAGNRWAATEDYNSARQIDAMETMAFITGNLFRSGVGK